MASNDPRAKYGLSCPSRGNFYICTNTTTQFIGCCLYNPCDSYYDGICMPDYVRPASFSSGNYGDIPSQNCSSDAYAGSKKSQWYTCEKTSPPFLGCCASNPCRSGSCPSTDMGRAQLSDDKAKAAPFLAETTTSTTATSTTTPTSVSTSSSATTSATNAAVTGSNGGLSAGPIVGIVLGLLVALLIFGYVLYKFIQRRRIDRDVEERSATQFTAVYKLQPPSTPAAACTVFSPDSDFHHVKPNPTPPLPSANAELMSPVPGSLTPGNLSASRLSDNTLVVDTHRSWQSSEPGSSAASVSQLGYTPPMAYVPYRPVSRDGPRRGEYIAFKPVSELDGSDMTRK